MTEGSPRTRFERQLAEIATRLAEESVAVRTALASSVRAFLERDARLAGTVMDADRQLDRMEVEVERLCIETLALQQPVAIDLRFLTAAVKVNADLERMGDLCCNLAKLAWRLSAPPPETLAGQLAELGRKVDAMTAHAAEALAKRDAAAARTVWSQDAEIDRLYRRTLRRAVELLDGRSGSTPSDVACAISAARNLERIGDHAKNIAEDVVFLVEGDIVRHDAEARISPLPPDGV